MSENWSKRKVTILGLGRSGMATASYLAKRGARVLLSESEAATPKRLEQAREMEAIGVQVELGGQTEESVKFGDLVITSPGIKPSSPIIQKALQLGKEVIADVELAYRETRTPMVAITGTNGKSTTTALTSYILEKSGKVAPACGNIGVPILSQLEKPLDYLVVELSSYQLYYCQNLAPKIGTWMNLTPDHLDWHEGLDGYIAAKAKLFENQRPDQFCVLNMDDPVVALAATRSEIFPFSASTDLPFAIQGAFVKDGYLAYRLRGKSHIICHQNDLKILGKHNLENALAAVSMCALLGLPADEIEKHLTSFTALEHRLEFVATIDGVSYYNDSKATNTDSSIKALESFPNEKVVLIAGGKDKGTHLGDFVHAVKNYASAVILIGEAKERFEQAMREGGVESIYKAQTLDEAVTLAGALKLGPVLLSPACASFDMFTDFEDRGRAFKTIVRARHEKIASSA